MYKFIILKFLRRFSVQVSCNRYFLKVKIKNVMHFSKLTLSKHGQQWVYTDKIRIAWMDCDPWRRKLLTKYQTHSFAWINHRIHQVVLFCKAWFSQSIILWRHNNKLLYHLPESFSSSETRIQPKSTLPASGDFGKFQLTTDTDQVRSKD